MRRPQSRPYLPRYGRSLRPCLASRIIRLATGDHPEMSTDVFVRIEVGLDGGQILSALVTPASADELERSLNAGVGGALSLEAQDGAILLVLPRVLYPKGFGPGHRLGFE